MRVEGCVVDAPIDRGSRLKPGVRCYRWLKPGAL